MQNTVVRQRADYTHKYNRVMGRHGWLRLTPAYSVKVVEEILAGHDSAVRVLDPFAGTATTALCAAYLGLPASTIEINPFLVWLGKAKTATYSHSVLEATREKAEFVLKDIRGNRVQAIEPPPIHNIERWWHADALSFLCRLKSGIDQTTSDLTSEKTLLLIAFCRLMIKLSNAAFNHQSMSFKDVAQDDLFLLPQPGEYEAMYREDLDFVLASAVDNPLHGVRIYQGDACNIKSIFREKFDLLITSPPYPNRISYIRELRPYMYWLGYLRKAREAGEMDWKTVGGTWGVATSRLLDWKRSDDGFYPGYFVRILKKISEEKNKNGHLLSNYIAKYFEDIWKHLNAVKNIMNTGGKVHYIIGNSTFYGILLPVERLYHDMLEAVGFTDIEVRTIRKRNSKKELLEFDVSGRWSG